MEGEQQITCLCLRCDEEFRPSRGWQHEPLTYPLGSGRKFCSLACAQKFRKSCKRKRHYARKKQAAERRRARARDRARNLTPERRQKHNERAYRNRLKRRALIEALRELGLVRGYEIVEHANG
jgi:hypothetical protein